MEPVLQLTRITKRYPGVTALDQVSVSFRPGEVHALLGENGAGKSTLIKVITGAVRPDSGEIVVDGRTSARMEPDLARRAGIEAVYQELNLVDSLTVAENVCFGERYGRFVDRRAMRATTLEVFARLGVDIDPGAVVRDLSTAQKQLVEIAKSVSRNAKILIMDEPSAPLSVAEVGTMFDIVRSLRARGVAIIYISHRLDEVADISDRVTVLRDGRHVATVDTVETSAKQLTSLMVGRELSDVFPRRTAPPGGVALEVRGLGRGGAPGTDLTVRRGEIVGLAGLVGAGRTELVRLIFGADRSSCGEVRVGGERIRLRTPNDAIRHGMGLIPEDRKNQGCFLEKSIRWNVTIASLRRLLKAGAVVDRRAEAQVAQSLCSRLRVKAPSLDQQTKNLSGGNQQKVVLAKTLATSSDIVIFDEPTRGIDVGAKAEIYQMICDLADDGKAIILVTSEMNELVGLCDRIVVLYQGAVVGELERGEFSQERILELASGLR